MPPEHVKKAMLCCKPWQLQRQWARKTDGRDVSARSDEARAEALPGGASGLKGTTVCRSSNDIEEALAC